MTALPAMTGIELARWRVSNRITQSALAACLGVHTMTVSRWERCGDNLIPRRAVRLLAYADWSKLKLED